MRVVGFPIRLTKVPQELHTLVSDNNHVMDFAVRLNCNGDMAYALHVVPYDSLNCAVVIFQHYENRWQGFDPEHPQISPLLKSLSDFMHNCLEMPPAMREYQQFVYINV